MKIFAILPCYNEELNIAELIEEWVNQKEELAKTGYDLIIVGIDDCSKDKTKDVILKCSKKYDFVKLEAHSVNKGLCGGLTTAINFFWENGSSKDLMVLMDGDNTHDPKYIHAMLEKLKNKDCVIASRYCVDSSIVGVAHHREFMSDMAKLYYSFILKVPDVKDYTCGYRVYTYPVIEKLVTRFGKEPLQETSFACMMELLYKLHLCGARFDEIGFKLRYDQKQGESKMNVFKTMRRSLSTALTLRKLGKKEVVSE